MEEQEMKPGMGPETEQTPPQEGEEHQLEMPGAEMDGEDDEEKKPAETPEAPEAPQGM